MRENAPNDLTIFNEALEITAPAERAAYIERACGADTALREKIYSLLAAYENDTDGFDHLGETPVVGIRAKARDLEQSGSVIGRYKLLQKIGEGGCGVVYMADQEEPVKRRVALKLIKPGMDTKSVLARFEAERQALALMDHPNIAKVLEAGATETGRPFFVMELVRGIPITRFCDENRLPTRQRLELFIQVCHAIQHAHQKGIIHRDIKPSNILVADHDGVPVPKIIDFGIAKATAGQTLTDKTVFTALEQFIGTPAYMSPEQAKMSALDVDTRSDIYSLGVLLYELLTGKTPFDARKLFSAGLDEIRRVIREEEPQRPSQKLSTLAAEDQTTAARARQTDSPRLIHLVCGDLDWIVMKCLEKDRTRRYETANGLAADLNRHLENEPVVARPPSNLYRFQKMVRRNKLAFAAAAMVTLALLVGIALATWQAVRASRERDAKELALREQTRLRSEAETAQQQARAEASRAEAAAGEVRMTLAASDFGEARRLIQADEGADAVAYLSRILSADPSNRAALSQLATLLTYHSWMVPTLSLKHEDRVVSAQFSPDGKRIVTASWDNTARVWDAQTGQPLGEPMKHGDYVKDAQFSPDGTRIVTASADDTARVWNGQTGQPLTPPMTHGGAVYDAEFSADGARIVTASADGTARIWDAHTGQPLGEPMKHKDYVVLAQFSPDGTRVITASRDHHARVWDAQTGRPLTEPMEHLGWVNSARFSPDGKRIVTASADTLARVWDAQTGQPLTPLPHGDAVWDAQSSQWLTGPLQHGDPVHFAEFSPDGKRILTASADNTARVWDAQTGQPLTGPLKHREVVHFAQFSPDVKRIVTASYDHTARLWDAQTGQPLTGPMQHGDHVSSARFSPDGRRVVTASDDDTAQVWDAPIVRALPLSLTAQRVCSAQFSPDGKRIVTASDNGRAQVWDAQTGEQMTQPFGSAEWLFDAEFSPDGKRVATASRDGTARVWDAQTGQPLTGLLKHEDRVYSSEFSPDGKRIVTASADHTARVWDAQTGRLLTQPLQHGDWVVSAHFSPDGKHIVTASWDKTARIWDAQTGQPLSGPVRHHDKVYSARFSPDGKRIVTASWDCTARVWDAQTGQPLTESMRHKDGVGCAQFSPDGTRIATASQDRTARIWDAQTGQPLTDPLQHGEAVWFVQFSLDGNRIVTASPTVVVSLVAPVQFSTDGNRVVTASSAAEVWDAQTGQLLTEPLTYVSGIPPEPEYRGDSAAREWDVGFVPSKLPSWLLLLAEAISGQRLNKLGALEETTLDRAKTIAQIRQDLNDRPGTEDSVRWGRWLLSDPANRTISPSSVITVSNYIEDRIAEQTPEALEETERLAYGNAEQRQRIWASRDRLLQIDVLSSNGVLHVRFAQWSNAVEDYSKLIEMDRSNQWDHLCLAALLVQSGDLEGYHRLCTEVLAIFGGTKDPVIAEQMAKACLIFPAAGIDLEAVARLADTAVARGQGAWIELAKGLAEYRQGHFASAIDWIQKVVADPSEGARDARNAEADLVLAMSLHQSGKLAESRAVLDKAAQVIETKRPKVGIGDFGEINWLISQALMEEAKGLIR